MLTHCARSCDSLGFEVQTLIEPEEGIVTNTVGCSTTKGDLTIEIYRDWSPLGADHFLELVRSGFYSEIGEVLSCQAFVWKMFSNFSSAWFRYVQLYLGALKAS